MTNGNDYWASKLSIVVDFREQIKLPWSRVGWAECFANNVTDFFILIHFLRIIGDES